VRSGLLTLGAARHLALGSDGEITMAHPFSAVPLGFSVMGRTHCGGGCGCDSFALAAGPGSDAGGDDVLGVRPGPCLAGRRTRAAGGQVAHFLVPATRMWDDVVDTCGNQRIFCSEACVATWLNESGHQRGSVLDLQTLWRLAAGWYAGRLERGYVRREPSAAAGLLGGVGALRRLLGPHLGVIDGGLPCVFR
jgi:hypothetical protein